MIEELLSMHGVFGVNGLAFKVVFLQALCALPCSIGCTSGS